MLSLILNHPFQNSSNVDGGPVANPVVNLRKVRDASQHIFKPFCISLFVWDMHDGRVAAGDFLYLRREGTNRNFFRTADVEDFTFRPVPLRQTNQCPDDISHEGKTTGLLTSTVNGDRPPPKSLSDKARDNHPVTSCLARSNCVEQADDDN